jgi:hypothetical protein
MAHLSTSQIFTFGVVGGLVITLSFVSVYYTIYNLRRAGQHKRDEAEVSETSDLEIKNWLEWRTYDMADSMNNLLPNTLENRVVYTLIWTRELNGTELGAEYTAADGSVEQIRASKLPGVRVKQGENEE